MRIVKADMAPYALPFEEPLRTSRGTATHRHGWLLKLEDDEGRIGWGDAARWTGFAPKVTLDEPDSALEVKGAEFAGVAALADWLAEQRFASETAYAVELAVLSLLAQRDGVAIVDLLGGASPKGYQSHLLWTGLLPEGEAPVAIKIKVGSYTVEEDERRIRDARAQVGGDCRIRLDAGGAWDADTALFALRRFAEHDIELIEEPVSIGDFTGLKQVRSGSGIPVAADESVARLGIDDVLASNALDWIVVKPMFVGGLLAGRRIIERVTAAGLRVLVTNALESAVGRAGAEALAATVGGVHGLGGPFRDDEEAAVLIELGATPAATPERAGQDAHAPHGAQDARAPSPELKTTVFQPPRLPDPLDAFAAARPDHPALVFGSRTLTSTELRDAAARRAGGMSELGVRAGSVVALAGDPCIDWLVSFHAVGRLGAVAAPLPAGVEGAQRARLLALLKPDYVVDAGSASDGEPHPSVGHRLDDERLRVMTSGTGGAPRVISLTAGQLAFSAAGSAMRLGHHLDDRWLCCLPQNHVGGLSVHMRCALNGTTAVLHDGFDPARVNDEIDAGTVTMVSLVPEMLSRLLDARSGRRFPYSLRVILLGGAAAPKALISRCRAIAAPVALTWGMTEAGSQVATRLPGDLREGGLPPLPFTSVTSGRGRLTVAGPTVGGAFSTSDHGAVDQDGNVEIAGRIDDVIISGGENIDPAEVEAALFAIDDVEDCIVFGIPSERWGHRPVALAIPVEGRVPSAESLKERLGLALEPFKRPDRIVWVDKIPCAQLGKPSRSAARRLFDELEAAQPLEEAVGRPVGFAEGRQINEGVDQLGGRADVVGFAADDSVGEGDAPSAEALDGELDAQAVTHANGSSVVGLGVDERHSDLAAEPVSTSTVDGHEELLERRVAVLVDPTKEEDPGAVDLVEARRHIVKKGHDDDRV